MKPAWSPGSSASIESFNLMCMSSTWFRGKNTFRMATFCRVHLSSKQIWRTHHSIASENLELDFFNSNLWWWMRQDVRCWGCRSRAGWEEDMANRCHIRLQQTRNLRLAREVVVHQGTLTSYIIDKTRKIGLFIAICTFQHVVCDAHPLCCVCVKVLGTSHQRLGKYYSHSPNWRFGGLVTSEYSAI